MESNESAAFNKQIITIIINAFENGGRTQFLRTLTCKRFAKRQAWRSFWLLNALAISAIFFIIEYSVLMVLQFNYKGMLEKIWIERTQQFSDVFFVPVTTQLNAAHARLNVE